MAWLKRKVPDPQTQVTQAIDKLERSNAMIVRAAHAFAFALIIATSVASLISLAAAVLAKVISDGGHNIANDASIAITLLLVMAMDTGMILAATYIRIARQRSEPFRKLAGHLIIMVIVASLEAGTYCYMLFLYEHPATWLAGMLIIARGLAVPVLSIYLAMAQEITVTTSDIARMTEIFSGVGLLRDLVKEANNPQADLSKKIAIYRAAATLSAAQRDKLDNMYMAVTGKPLTTLLEAPSAFVDADPDQPDEMTLEAASGQLRYGPESPELQAYNLPSGITLTTMDSIKNVARMLGFNRQDVIGAAMKTAEMVPAGAITGQAHNAKNIAVWQVLALIEAGLLEMPANVTKRLLSVVN